MSLRPRSSADLTAGLVFVGLGVAFGVGSLRYELGSLLNMGPGYVPLLGAVLLVGLGLAVAVKAYVAPDLAHLDLAGPAEEPQRTEEPQPAAERHRREGGLAFGEVQWRPLVLVSASVLFFAVTVDGAGLLPATFGTALIVCFAARDTTVVRAVATAVGLTTVSLVIFVVLLQLRVALFGEWFG